MKVLISVFILILSISVLLGQGVDTAQNKPFESSQLDSLNQNDSNNLETIKDSLLLNKELIIQKVPLKRLNSELRIPSYQLWELIVAFSIGILFTFIRLFFVKHFTKKNLLLIDGHERTIYVHQIFHLILFSFVAALVIQMFLPVYEESVLFCDCFIGYSLILLLVLGLVSLKLFFYYIIFQFLEQGKLAANLIHSITNNYYLITIISFPLWLLYTFSGLSISENLTQNIVITIFIGMLLWRWSNVIIRLIQGFKYPKFFLLFYFCGLEIIPVLLLYSIVTGL